MTAHLVLVTFLLTVPALLQGQAAPQGSANGAGSAGVVIVAHGGDSTWNAQVAKVASSLKAGGPVEVSFLMGSGARNARFQDAVSRLEARGVASIAVVPLLVSSYSGHYDQIRWLAGDSVTLSETMMHHLHMSGIERPATKIPLRVTSAMDDAGEVARVLSDRALALTKTPGERALMIVGHGPNSAEDNAKWMENLRRLADSVKTLTGFRDVRVGVVRDDAPAAVRAEAVRGVREIIELQHLATGKPVIVVPILVSKGSVSRDKLPADLKGTPSIYAGEPLLPHPVMARWIERKVREVVR